MAHDKPSKEQQMIVTASSNQQPGPSAMATLRQIYETVPVSSMRARIDHNQITEVEIFFGQPVASSTPSTKYKDGYEWVWDVARNTYRRWSEVGRCWICENGSCLYP